ncbi:MAG: methionine--tRNA ligase [Nitrospira sp.]
MTDKPTFYITTPIYYVNDVPHIGHAYTTIAADVLARYWKLRGREVFFLTGLDEHGQKVQQAAAKAGIDPQTHCDTLAPQFETLWRRLNISNSAFIRTTDDGHKSVVQRYLQQLYNKNLIYQDSYTGWYCTFDERFWTEKDVESGLCPDCKRPVEKLSEHNYFFKMGQYQNQLLDYITEHPSFIRPESRRNEVLGFLQTQKLGDLSISRPKSRLSWGIELPFDQDYVTYVWFDALVNYMSALEYLPRGNPAGSRFWPANTHLVGKDILTTHAVYWSAMLMALNLPLPETIFAHGWWTVDGAKMSKSRGNVVDPYKMVDEFGADSFRYFLLREVPFGQDGDFSQAALVTRINSDLANGLGNLLSRTLTLIERTQAGQVPAPSTTGPAEHELQQSTVTLLNETLPRYLEQLEFNRALEAIWHVVQLANQYVDKTAPWALAKDERHAGQLRTVLYTMAEMLRCLSLATYPVIPTSAQSISAQLGISVDFITPLLKNKIEWGGLNPGTRIHKGPSLFPRVESKPQGAKSVNDLSATPQPTAAVPTPTPAPPVPPQITIDEFMKIELKTAKILSAERVPKSGKLIKLQVSLGAEQCQIVAGIGKKYEPDALVGKTIVIVAKLEAGQTHGH